MEIQVQEETIRQMNVKHRTWFYVVSTIVALAALFSFYVGVKEALVGGMDLQWSGAHLLAQGQDPWKTFLEGDPLHQILLGQQPNYLAEYFLLLYPMGCMSLPHAVLCWCMVNLILLGCTLFLAGRMFQLSARATLLLTLLTISSTPFRVVMANGQASIFILFVLTVFYSSQSMFLRGLTLGLSYSKYSFTPLIVLVQLFKRRIAPLAISLVPPLLGILIAMAMLHESFPAVGIGPFLTARVAMGPGWADIMTLVEAILKSAGASSKLAFAIPAILGLCCAFCAAVFLAKLKSIEVNTEFVLVLVFTLLCFKHLIYDFVVLLVPVAALIAKPLRRAHIITLACIGYFWYGETVLHRLHFEQGVWVYLCNFAVLTTLAVFCVRALVPPCEERA
jgi:hypothetical protein